MTKVVATAAALRRALACSRVIDIGTADSFARAHIPGAVRSPVRGDLKGDAFSPLSPGEASALFAALDLRQSQPVLVYDSGEALPSARLAWVLRYYGHPDVSVLCGGFGAYLRARGLGRPGTAFCPAAGAALPPPPSALPPLLPSPQPALLAQRQDVLAALAAGPGAGAQVLDARSEGEYSGAATHGLPRAGHIPGAISIPFTDCFAPSAPAARQYRGRAAMRQLLQGRGVDLARPTIVLCLAGVRASCLQNALHIAGASPGSSRLYDGSMAEWALDPSLPMQQLAGTAGPQ